MFTHRGRLIATVWCICVGSSWPVSWSQTSSPSAAPQSPVIAAASAEGTVALAGVKLADGLHGELIAAEPLVANIVALTIDDRGQIWVCETFRQEQGVTDNRSHDEKWLERDLAALTVADRIAYHRELLPNQGSDYTRQDDRIRLLRDRDGDGKIDDSSVFADRFNQLEDGTGAGVLVLGDRVLYTCIPHLWSLRDRDGDGVADERESLQFGFGVRVAFRGHDLHGLIRGPDGRVYFSIGDRGYHLVTREGQTWADPASGAVFRCEPDGSHLEVVATGLRNPQELVFDDLGNLFTGDNNSDSGDQARWVYVLPGGDSGWRMHYQYLPDRGPFNRERIWQPFHAEQPAYILPPIANFSDGPSGVAYYPGTGFGPGWLNHFFLCDFRGTPAVSGVRAFRLEPVGAFFRLVEPREPIWQVLATDLAFAPDGGLYVSDWVNGWVGEGKGRIYRFADPATLASPEVAAVQKFLQRTVTEFTLKDLRDGLASPDQRVRLKAQWELAARGAGDELRDAVEHGGSLNERLHGLWGLEQMARAGHLALIEPLWSALLQDSEPEIRGQARRLVGDLKWEHLREHLTIGLADPSPRVQLFSALALHQFQLTGAEVKQLGEMLKQVGGQDPARRHAAIYGLKQAPARELAELLADTSDMMTRRALAVVLRNQRSPDLVHLLRDSASSVAEEAARGLYDPPAGNKAEWEALAASDICRPEAPELTRRSMSAAFYLGTAAGAEHLARLANDERYSPELRYMAMSLLGEWSSERTRDPVLGCHRPRAAHPREPAAAALSRYLPVVLQSSDPRLIAVTWEAVERLRPPNVLNEVTAFVQDTSRPVALRAAALRALAQLSSPKFIELGLPLMSDQEPELRSESQRLMAEFAPAAAIPPLIRAVKSGELREQQTAWKTLRRLTAPEVLAVAREGFAQMSDDRLAPELRLDVWETARTLSRYDEELAGAVAAYEPQLNPERGLTAFRDSLLGGDAQRGRQLFFERAALSCLRCHRVGLEGGNVGPNLSEIGKLRDRTHLLESIVFPNAAISEKFGTVVVRDVDGRTWTGIVHFEDAATLRLMTADGELVTLAQADIDERRSGQSAMPADLIEKLSREELRDLIEYLAQLQSPPQPDVESLEIR